MRLKTKFQDEDFDLGEVVEANIYHGGNGGVKVIAEPTKGGMITFYFETLKGLNEMFEDYEEPIYYYFIQDDGRIGCDAVEPYNHKSKVEEHKSIGNYFGTREEAEKAVERLRAWKRLKDKGFRFNGCSLPSDKGMCIYYETDIETWTMQDLQDFKVLFGGEE